MIEAPTSRVNFLLSRLSRKTKEWVLWQARRQPKRVPHSGDSPERPPTRVRASAGRVAHACGLLRPSARQDIYARLRTEAHHLVSCIVTNPIDVASQGHVFIFGMCEGMTRYCLTRAEPSTLETAFALALREDYTVTSSYARVLTSDARTSTPEPMEIDVIEAESRSRSPIIARGPRFNNDNRPRDGRPLICYRCRKSDHRAAVCRAPAPVRASAEAVGEAVGEADDMLSTAHPKTVGTSRCGALYWLERRTWPPSDNWSS
ncbi:unnamed protein product [Phytophthora fragariaefolia]|uniref:Unnamed protein product n=1 Tax=Phytophthora fragariaefolia TaxID=1490495 RepID=A0A9W7CYW0_9STRA|nr:unnamed protein product [Phytophthora fragariaefolia]